MDWISLIRPFGLIILTLPLDVSEAILDAARLSAGVTFVI
ncbi:hypothetical protein HIMB11_00279 [Rhodobacteraceae bacterium HIMB11]|nr:hypothetical protein HIMB11_00279 [Rhodobacteraceae bacterium HIMB11]